VEWVEITAATVAQAREKALDRLGVDASDAEIEVLAEPQKRLLGLRRSSARVRARVKPRKPRPKRERPGRERSARSSRANGRRARSGGKGGATKRTSDSGSESGSGPTSTPPSTQKTTRRTRGVGTSAKAGSGRSGNGAGGSGSGSAKAGSGRTRRRRRGGASRSKVKQAGAPDSQAESRVEESALKSEVAGTPTSPTSTLEVTTNNGVRRRTRRYSPPTGGDKEAATVTEEMTLEEQGQVIVDFLDGLVKEYEASGQARVVEIDEDRIEVAIDGSDLGFLIGPGGDTLMALHEVTKTVLQRKAGAGPRARLRLDVAGYREFRRAELAKFVEEMAEKARAGGIEVALEPMSAADRKVVHDTANEIEGVDTISVGDDPRRRVVLVPTDE